MWKPGTAKPVDTQNRSDDAPSKSTNKPPAKKLSSATMGMRFMKHKSPSSSQHSTGSNGVKSKSKPTTPEHQTRDGDHQAASHDDCNDDPIAIVNTERNLDIESTPISSKTHDATTLLEMATVVDMYGQGSDIIGRRSFGGFHPSVRVTWEQALRTRTDENGKRKELRKHLSDEELLRRYERHVKKSRTKEGGDAGRKDKKKRRG